MDEKRTEETSPAAFAPEVPSARERVDNPVPHPAFDQFVATISALRAPDGCPWDKEQTHESIAHNMIEEAYEAVDCIESGDVAHLREELGDVLMQVVLHSQIARDAGEFTVDDVCAEVNDKLVRRHPHVFGQADAGSAAEVLDLWDRIKLKEKEAQAAQATDSADEAGEGARSKSPVAAPQRLLDGVPTSFPALMQAQKIARKAAAAGFEWGDVAETWDKVYEEIGELNEAYAAAPKAKNGKMDPSCAPAPAAAPTPAAPAPAEGARDARRSPEELVAAAEMELGDVLFSLIRVANKMGIDAESALRASCRKFRARWEHMEDAAAAQGAAVEDLPFDVLDALWDGAKVSAP